ncbi:MAG: hypothetical protein ACI9UK_000693 [Candidatus Krumholzibacteriia bacterium]|jgi:hypothetical protein
MKQITTMIAVVLVSLLAATAWAQDTGWVVTSDFSSFGRLQSFGLNDPWSVSDDFATIPGDAVGRYHDGLLYIVGRGGANLLQVYDPNAGMVLLTEFSLGSNLNPQDIAIDSAGDAYISCYDSAVLLRVDVATEQVVASYSTAIYADADGLPETAWLKIIGDTLYISCQKLDRNNFYSPTGPGSLLVFDTVNETFSAPISLVGENPYTPLEVVADGTGGFDLRVGCVGFFGLNDGGVETIDTSASASLGFDVTEAVLGGDINAVVTTALGEIHTLISDGSFNTSLRKYNYASESLSVLLTGNGFVHAALAYDGDFQVFLADRTVGAAGMRVFDSFSGVQLTSNALATGLPPSMIILPAPSQVSAVPVTPLNSGLSLGAPFPNPCNPRAEIDVAGKPNAVTELSVYDLRGRRLLTQKIGLDSNGHSTWNFSGIDTEGRALPAGVYRIVAQNDAGLAARSVTLVK